jgi:hypothetical protein
MIDDNIMFLFCSVCWQSRLILYFAIIILYITFILYFFLSTLFLSLFHSIRTTWNKKVSFCAFKCSGEQSRQIIKFFQKGNDCTKSTFFKHETRKRKGSRLLLSSYTCMRWLFYRAFLKMSELPGILLNFVVQHLNNF